MQVASTISEAWQVLHLEVLPELLVLDLSLPDGIGSDLCGCMREDGIKIPVLMVTGRGEVSDRVLALDADVDDYLVKPFSMDELWLVCGPFREGVGTLSRLSLISCCFLVSFR